MPRLFCNCVPGVPSQPQSRGDGRGSWLHRGEAELTQPRGCAGNRPPAPPLDRVARPQPLPVGTSYLLQRVHHGLQVQALGELLLPPATAKRERRSEGGLPRAAHPQAQCQHPPWMAPRWLRKVQQGLQPCLCPGAPRQGAVGGCTMPGEESQAPGREHSPAGDVAGGAPAPPLLAHSGRCCPNAAAPSVPVRRGPEAVLRCRATPNTAFRLSFAPTRNKLFSCQPLQSQSQSVLPPTLTNKDISHVAVIIPFLQMRKLRLREVTYLAQRHTAS